MTHKTDGPSQERTGNKSLKSIMVRFRKEKKKFIFLCLAGSLDFNLIFNFKAELKRQPTPGA